MKKEIKHNCATNMNFDSQKGKCVTNDQHGNDIKKHCATDMVFSDEKGKCVNPNLETVDGAEYPDDRNRSAPNLKFPRVKKKGVQGVDR